VATPADGADLGMLAKHLRNPESWDMMECALLGHPMVPMGPVSGTVLATECIRPNALHAHGAIT